MLVHAWVHTHTGTHMHIHKQCFVTLVSIHAHVLTLSCTLTHSITRSRSHTQLKYSLSFLSDLSSSKDRVSLLPRPSHSAEPRQNPVHNCPQLPSSASERKEVRCPSDLPWGWAFYPSPGEGTGGAGVSRVSADSALTGLPGETQSLRTCQALGDAESPTLFPRLDEYWAALQVLPVDSANPEVLVPLEQTGGGCAKAPVRPRNQWSA